MNEVKSPKKPLLYYYLLVMLVLLLFNLLAMPWISEHQIKEVDYNTFVSMVEKKEIGKVDIQEQDNRILFTDTEEKTIYKTAMVPDDDLVSRLLEAGISTSGTEIQQTSLLVSILGWVLPLIIFIGLGQMLSRSLMKKMGGGNSMMFNMGKSNAKVYVKSAEGIKFDDVAGEDEAKENLQEVVNYLHDPSKYQDIGASMPKGILLVGPPGTGKTMLAKAVAGEANVPFFSMSGSEFVEMFVGMGASKVRDLFRQAKEKAPCIVFIDEIDAIGKKRDGQLGGNDEREQTLNQLLTEMDGFEGNTGVIILAATNRPESLDPALTRPGRFDRRVPVELPDLKGREEILKVHAKKIKIAEDVDFNKVARMASGASGAELANIVNEAALRAVRDGRRFATQADLEESIEVREYDIGPGELEYCISFRLPEHSGPEEEWNLHIAGRAETEALGGISLHYFDGEDWTAEKTYGIYLSSGQAADLTELTMEVWPPHGGRTGTYDAALHGRSIDLRALLREHFYVDARGFSLALPEPWPDLGAVQALDGGGLLLYCRALGPECGGIAQLHIETEPLEALTGRDTLLGGQEGCWLYLYGLQAPLPSLREAGEGVQEQYHALYQALYADPEELLSLWAEG